MDYLIATIVIMLFCITALAQERHPDSIMLISRPRPKPIRHGKVRAKHVAKYTGVVPVSVRRPGMEAGENF
ncbi:hypothetical protein [Mucilaginibacter sp. FT3.2]|uniref:hypothetical protein n=1 Tax=Mucilaginibacter sp. FT3.2 TaxID=2723090 RepID=UPI001608B21F|nr:hypothetical protein [Mucilaginibacter sp. FT3.2]MBB6229933.1 hypothetical protein [Mucilaginibacter sp. FT3.2]